MPIYLAVPRGENSTSRQKRLISGKTEYVKTAPTQVFIQTLSTVLSPLLVFVEMVLHIVYMSILAARKKETVSIMRCDGVAQVIFGTNPQIVDIAPPTVTIAFDDTITEEQNGYLSKWNSEPLDIEGKGRVYKCSIPVSDFPILSTWGNLDVDIIPVGGSISATMLASYLHLIRLMGAVTETLAIGFGRKANNVGIANYGSTEKSSVYVAKAGTPMAGAVGDVTVMKGEDHDFGVFVRDYSPTVIHGTMDNLPLDLTHGIFLPFEANYTAWDNRALDVLQSNFPGFFGTADGKENTYERLMDLWLNGLARTQTGMFLGHWIACLEIAKRAHVGVYVLMRGNIYEGCVLYGGPNFELRQYGFMVHRALSKEDLALELDNFSSHNRALSKIIAAAGIMAEPSAITSLRQLQKLVYQGKEKISATVKDEVDKNLPFLAFYNSPAQMTPKKISDFLDYISPSSPRPIPDTEYLNRSLFHYTDPLILAIGMFASFISPYSGNEALPVLDLTKDKPISVNKSPATVRIGFKRTVDIAAQDWRSFLSNGSMSVNTGKKQRFCHIFKKGDAGKVWSALGEVAIKGIQAKRQAAIDKRDGLIVERSKKRKLEGLDQDPAPDTTKGAKKAKTVSMDF